MRAPYFAVVVAVDGLGEVFSARCFAPQLAGALELASRALVAPAVVEWLTRYQARFTFEVRPA